MTDVVSQPHALPLPPSLVEALLRVVKEYRQDHAGVHVQHHHEYSNDLAELRFDDGRTLMVKRGRHGWARERFETSRRASSLLRRHAAVLAPAPLPLPGDLDERPVEAYWRIELPTLRERWPRLDAKQREQALRSWGRLLRRVHRVRLPGYGSLADAPGSRPLDQCLHADLADRLLPAVYAEWPAGLPSVERMLAALPTLAQRARGRSPVLAHSDMHMGNVLCDEDEDGVRCVGLLDLETCGASLPETDLAVAEVQHGPLFNHPLPDGWVRLLHEGYGTAPDPFVLGFFRAYHLANMGFYSALVGHAEHAQLVADALREESEALAEYS